MRVILELVFRCWLYASGVVLYVLRVLYGFVVNRPGRRMLATNNPIYTTDDPTIGNHCHQVACYAHYLLC